MINKYFTLLIALCTISNISAQEFSSASQGVFSSDQKVKIMLTDSTEAEYYIDTTDVESDMESELALIESDGGKVILMPEEILYMEIYRGKEAPLSLGSADDEDEERNGKLSFLPKQNDKLVFEKVEVTKRYGTPYEGKYRSESYLLQLVSPNRDDFLKVYLAPNFQDGATELAPKGYLIETLDRNRVDYTAVEEYYFIKVGDAPAFRMHADDYVAFAPLIYESSRGFRRKYSIPRDLAEEKTKKRKKTTRKQVGKGKKKTSPLRIDNFPKHLVEFHEFYVVEEAERQAKIKAREEARAARKAGRGK